MVDIFVDFGVIKIIIRVVFVIVVIAVGRAVVVVQIFVTITRVTVVFVLKVDVVFGGGHVFVVGVVSI